MSVRKRCRRHHICKSSQPVRTGREQREGTVDVDAAQRLLVDPPNVLAANHLQQAAEKILGAVRLHRGLLNTKDHDLVILIDGRPGGEPRPLPEGDPWRDRFRPLEPLSAYATTFRYSLSPTPKIE